MTKGPGQVTSQQANSNVDDNDRLGFAFVLVIGLHALLILGLGFESLLPDRSAQVLEVSLTQFRNDETPDKADFAAQFNQQGSGTRDDSAQLSSPKKSIYQDNLVKQVQLNKPTVIKHEPQQQKRILSSSVSEDRIYANTEMKKQPVRDMELSNKQQLLKQQVEIASLQAMLKQQKQLHAKGPKIRQITSVSAKATEDAAYINSFREKIEYVGNKYYPQEAKRHGYEGDVQLLVALKPDGYIESIEVLRSSNNPVLDKAAINSVRLAAPFMPFPRDMRKHTDLLEIIRTWQFRREQLSTHG